MLKERVLQTLRWTLIFCAWIFGLSIKIDGRTIFSYSNEILVQNKIVQAIGDQADDVWYRARVAARTALADHTSEMRSRR
jgi:hypothetical protein